MVALAPGSRLGSSEFWGFATRDMLLLQRVSSN